MAVRYKKFGRQEYAYEIWNEKNSDTKKWIQRSRYLGVVIDKENGIYEKRRESKQTKDENKKGERYILDYGDSYFLNAVVSVLPISAVLKAVFGGLFDTLMSLVFHRITGCQAMRYAEDWYDGNYANRLFPNANVTSQNISRFLSYMGEESVQRAFFTGYIPLIQKDKSGVVIDSTGLPNEINMSVTDWGHHNGGIEYETRLILAIDRKSGLPLYFRYVAGNIGDVSTLANTIAEMKKLGIPTSSALVDAGYFSETNLTLLFAAKISFLIRMPSNRTVYKNIIAENIDIENPQYAIKYDKRGLFVKENEIEIYGCKAFAYLVLDPERRGREITKIITRLEDDGSDIEKTNFSNCGKMVLLSSEKLAACDVVPLYYTRQIAERMFGIAKDDLNILPLRTHSEPNFKGFMLLVFISLIISCAIKERLGKKISIEQTISTLKNLKCKVFDDAVVPNEVSKKQRLIFEAADVLVPNIRGI
jgi:transposase